MTAAWLVAGVRTPFARDRERFEREHAVKSGNTETTETTEKRT